MTEQRNPQSGPPTKVLVVTAAFPPMKAGEADHAYHICAQLARKGADVHVLTTQTQGSLLPQNASYTVHDLMRDWAWRDLLRLARFVRRCQPDAVLLYYLGWIYNDHPMITFAPTLCRKILPRSRFVTMFAYPHGSKPLQFSLISRLIRKLVKHYVSAEQVDHKFGTLLRDSDQIVAMDDSHIEIFRAHHSAVQSKCITIPPPPLLNMVSEPTEASRTQTRTRIGLQPHHFLIAYFGFIYPPKGVETVLRAFHIVSKQNAFARLILIGGVLDLEFSNRPDFAQEMRQLPKQMGFDDRVVWTGEYATQSDDGSRYLYAADACVFAHDLGVAMNNSSFAAPVAHALPMVATRGDSVNQAIVHGENVLLCPPKDPDSMAKALLSIIENQQLRNRLSKGAMKLATEWFSWDKATDRIIEVLTAGRIPATPRQGTDRPQGQAIRHGAK